MDAQRERATLGKPAPDGTFHRRAGAKAPSDPIPWQYKACPTWAEVTRPIVGRTPAPSTRFGPFRGDWID